MLAALGLLAVLGAAQTGHWLTVNEDLPQQCQAVVVFGGGVPFRPLEAGRLFREGHAYKVWLTQGPISPEELALRQMGVERPAEHFYSAQVLEKAGVPPEAIRLLDRRVQNTAEEVRLLSETLQGEPGGCIILVSSKVHTRRVRILWDLLAPEDQKAYVRYATEDPFRPGQWWESTDSILAVARELGGITNAMLGFPIETRREAEAPATNPKLP